MAKRLTAGFRAFFFGVPDTNGFLIGNTIAGATVGDAAGEPMQRLRGAQVFPTGIPESEVVPVTGDDEVLATFIFSAPTLSSGTIELSVRDNAFDALAQGTQVESVDSVEMSVYQPGGQDFPDLMLLGMRRAKKAAGGSQGAKAWEIVLLLKTTVSPLFATMEQRAATPYQYSYAASKTDAKPYGATFTEALNSTETAPVLVIDSDNPVHFHAFTGDTAETVFNLLFTPIADTRVSVYVEGLKLTLTTDYTVSGKAVTFVSAPVVDKRVVVMYEFDEAELN